LRCCGYFRGRGKVPERKLDFLLSQGHALDERLDDPALLLELELGPALLEALALGLELILSQMLDAEEIKLALEPRHLIQDGAEALLERAIPLFESGGGDVVAGIEAEELGHICPGAGRLGFERGEALLALRDFRVDFGQVLGDGIGRDQDAFELLQEDRLEILT
jgi:hypothetical protein